MQMVLLTWLTTTVIATGQDPTQLASKQVVFYAMGDVPYVAAEDALLPRQIAAIPADAQFLVHLGDIKDGSTPCEEPVYRKVAGMLAKSAEYMLGPSETWWPVCPLCWRNTCGVDRLAIISRIRASVGTSSD